MRKEEAPRHTRPCGLPRIALAVAVLVVIGPGCTFATLGTSGGPAHTDADIILGTAPATPLFDIPSDAAAQAPTSFGSRKAGSGTATLGGASGGEAMALAYLSCLTSHSCASTTPVDRELFSLGDRDTRQANNSFDAPIGHSIATRGSLPSTPSVIPPVPLPAAFWLLGSGLLALVGFCRRRAGGAPSIG